MKKLFKFDPKAEKYATEYLYPMIASRLQDHTRSYYKAEQLEQRFLAIVNDEITIDDFIRQYLRKEYVAALKKVIKDFEIDSKYFAKLPFEELPFSYKEIKDEL